MKVQISISFNCPSEEAASRVTEAMGMEPTRVMFASGLVTTKESFAWVHDVVHETVVRWLDIEKRLNAFLEMKAPQLAKLTLDCEGDVIIAAEDDEAPTSVGVSISPETLKAIAKSGLSLKLSVFGAWTASASRD